jgi:hypothetical protein
MDGETDIKTITTYRKPKWKKKTEKNQLIEEYQQNEENTAGE